MKKLYLLRVAFCKSNFANAQWTSLYFGVRPLHANFYETLNKFYSFDFYQINCPLKPFAVRTNQSSTISITQHPETFSCKFSFSFTDPFPTDNDGSTQNPNLSGGFDVFVTPKKADCLISPPTFLINKQALDFNTTTIVVYNIQKQNSIPQSQTELFINNLPFGVNIFKFYTREKKLKLSL